MSNTGRKAGKAQSEGLGPSSDDQVVAAGADAADPTSSPGNAGNPSGDNAGATPAEDGSAGASVAAAQPAETSVAGASGLESEAAQCAPASDAGNDEASLSAATGEQLAAEVAADASGSEASDLSILSEAIPSKLAAVKPAVIEVFPLRTYQDDGELRRRGGTGYVVDKRHADALVQRGLASLKRPEG
ncbi:hypothetical protein ACNFBR_10340 [Pseudomonas sp. NY11955]|uniref:hypothetical protein n=1 Tax=Pseudomonas sp. NY11955 TaxID=3400363 RepID=UPI003A8B0668